MKVVFVLTIVFAIVSQINCLQENEACEACQKWSNFIWNVTQNADSELYLSMAKLCIDYSPLPKTEARRICYKSVRSLFEFLKDKWNKDRVCYDIQACTGNQVEEIYGFGSNNTDCEFCIYINTKIKELVTGDPTELEIKTHFEDVCHYMRSFEKECLNLVDEYIDTLFKFMREQFQPKKLCTSLRVCAPSSVSNIISLPSASELMNVMPVNISEEPVKDEPTCVICKKLVQIIQTQLKDNATDEQIINVLTEVCKLFPSKDQPKCEEVVDNYTKTLISILTQDIDPETACMMAGLCQQAFRDYLNGKYLNTYQTKPNAFCVECELIAHFIQNEIYNYKNEQQIEEFIKNHLCEKMAFIMSPANCQAFIDQYGPIIMQTIAQELFNPDLLCYKELHLCKKSKIRVIKPDRENYKCNICKNIVDAISEVRDQNDFNIKNIIKKGCAIYERQDECDMMVKTFVHYFVDMLDRYENADQICESIDICLAPGKVHLLGGHKCAYGPSYWCNSVSHASSCNALGYCHQKMWKH